MKRLLLTIFIGLFAAAGFAQWSNNPNVNTNIAAGTAGNRVTLISNIADGAGGILTVYREEIYDNTTLDWTYIMYVQRISAAGVKQWGSKGVGISNTGNEIGWPGTVSDGNGGVVLIWNEKTIAGDDESEKICMQRIDANGNRLLGVNGIDLVTDISEYGLAENIVRDAGGNYVFAYSDYADNKIYARKINSSGVHQWVAPILLNDGANLGEVEEGLIYPDGTGYTFVWMSEYQIAGEWGESVYWQKLNADGTKNGSNLMLYDFPPPTGPIDHSIDGVCPDGVGGFYVAVTEYSNTLAKLYLQHILSDGTKIFPGLGTEVDASIGKYVAGGNYVTYGIALISNGAGGAVISWTDTRSGNDGLYAQNFSSSGAKLWGGGAEVQVVPSLVLSNFYDSHLKVDSDGNFVFMVSKDVSNNNSHLYVQKLSPTGTVLYPAAGVFAAGRASSKYGELLTIGNKALLVWEDYFYDNINNQQVYNIHAQPVFSDGTLPVELTAFSASAKTYGVFLEWQTLTETNNSHFIVEKSIDGTNFQTINSVPGKGTTQEKSNYQFTDVNFTQSAYYRLTQVDNNGTKKVYNDMVRYVKALGANEKIAVYPNPTVESLFVKSSDATKGLTATLMDLTGKIIESKNTSGTELEFNLSRLPRGTYLVRSKDDKGTFTEKVVKQ
mgnify:CR=1 FL=1